MTDITCIDEIYPIYMPDGHWIDSKGDEVWVKNGKYHRADGPAITSSSSICRLRWWLNGKWYPFESWLIVNDEITDEQKVMLKLEYAGSTTFSREHILERK